MHSLTICYYTSNEYTIQSINRCHWRDKEEHSTAYYNVTASLCIIIRYSPNVAIKSRVCTALTKVNIINNDKCNTHFKVTISIVFNNINNTLETL